MKKKKFFFHMLLFLILIILTNPVFAAYSYGKNIEICAGTDLNKGQLVWIKDIDFSQLTGIQADLDDVRVFNNNSNTELQRIVQGTNVSTDGNIFFNLDKNILKNTCDTNYTLYYGDAAVSAPDTNTVTNKETFENYAVQTVPFNIWAASLSTEAGIETDQFFSPTKSFWIHTGTSVYGDFNRDSVLNFDENLGNQTRDYNFWVYYGGAFSGNGSIYLLIGGRRTNDGDYDAFWAITIESNQIKAGGTKVNIDINRWYKVQSTYTWHDRNASVKIYQDTDTNLIATIPFVGLYDSNAAVGIPVFFQIYNINAKITWFDDLTFFAPYSTNVILTGQADVTAPTITEFSFDFNNTTGWSSSIPNNPDLNAKCTDLKSGTLRYLITVNGETIFDETVPNESLVQLDLNQFINQSNLFTFTCFDKNNNIDYATTTGQTNNLYYTLFNLKDEQTNAAFDLSYVTRLTAKALDGNYVFDFKSANVTSKYFISSIDTTIRFDFNYVNGTEIFRDFALSLLDANTDTNVCAAKPQIFYQSYLTSSTRKGIILINNNTQCYSLAAYTQYTIQDLLTQSAYTIVAPYYAYIIDGNARTLLTLIDGSNAETINLDVIEFNLTSYSINLLPGTTTFYRTDSNNIIVYYNNPNNDAAQTIFRIYNENNTLLFSHVEIISPNDLNFFFDFTTLAYDVNVLKLEITITKIDGTIETKTTYFIPQLIPKPIVSSELFAVLAIILLFFGLTLTSTRLTFGWFGIVLCIIALGLLAISIQTWYIQFLEAITIVLLVYIALIMKEENLGVQ